MTADLVTAAHRTAPDRASRVALATGLRDHGDRLAVVTPEARLTYAELADRADAVADALGPVRRLVLVEAANDLAALAGYLGALRGGHVVLLVPRDRAQVADRLRVWDPDAVIGADGTVVARRTGARHALHPELALLLATSGSTGSPRLVRLSAAGVDANAAAIATSLDIRPTDRAATTLPMHYCYGLSVVHSNLATGAALLLDDRSVTDPAFWGAFRAHRGTSLHGVPHTFDLLDGVGFAAMDLPHLRYLTQAGGRLAPDVVRRWATVGARAGWRLHVMYGQTEATARMAVLPPERALDAPGAVGRPVPGGSLTIEPVDGTDGVGELVYRGENVMLGYADTPADLARGRTVHALRTGDLGRVRPDGLVEVVGRRSRFVKPFGVRVDLDGLEALLAGHGVRAAATGTDARVVVAAEGTTAGTVRTLLADRLPLPADALAVVVVDELPRRSNGKPDLVAVGALAERADRADAGEEPRPVSWWAPWRRPRPRTVREVFARTFPGRALPDEASFVDLGGDSLTYVQVAADVERALGTLPDEWDRLPLGVLAARDRSTSTRSGAWATVETVVVLRALAILLVVGEHTHLWSLLGGAHLLLVVAGWTFARFTLAGRDGPPDDPGWALPRRILRSTALLAVPASLWIAFRAATQENVHLADALLAGSVFHPLVQGYWFVDALVQTLLVMAALFAVPAVRRLDRTHPFALAAGALGVALLGWWAWPASTDVFAQDLYSTRLVLWLFVLGWAVQRARTPAARWAIAAAAAVLVPWFFGTPLERTAIVLGGLLVLLGVPRLVLPRRLATAATTVAAASFGIYLTHFALLPLRSLGVPGVVLVPLCLVVGVGAWGTVTAGVRRLAAVRSRPDRAVAVPTTDHGPALTPDRPEPTPCPH